jgi:hypothetical protein
MDFDGREITERVFKAARKLDISDTRLAKELGVPKQNMPKYKGNTLSIPAWRVIIFLGRHREISTDWLLFGDGEMFSGPGIYKMTMTDKGEMLFATEIPDKKTGNEEIKKLKAVLEEKEKQIELQNQTIKNQDEYVKKLLDKL